MTYLIQRDGQQFGPYTLEQLRGYVSAGSILPTDIALQADNGAMSTVAAVLEKATALHPPPGYVAPAYGFLRPEHVPIVPLPPNLHWAIVLVISLAFSLFPLGWLIYQMVWVRSLDLANKALVYLLAGFGVGLGGCLAGGLSMAFAGSDHFPVLGFAVIMLAIFAMWALNILSVFEVRRSMLAYYNTVEPIGLRLSGVMTFFFSLFYFQHHMSRIVTWKQTGYLSPQG
ncbi:hypothetical protein SAMN05421819_3225 [Bryocella elongata]|uniref:GYF domain-containing protein n=1 Tax=Bryocella elongata TaxID=863522 RepID=A0A1H6AKF3_9BACT|nr:DUF4339 domain-containing protein [Bryocella elongata]SEG49178.1 hypothetical protein SAMN05421819_3225 [Bryocella elongata]